MHRRRVDRRNISEPYDQDLRWVGDLTDRLPEFACCPKEEGPIDLVDLHTIRDPPIERSEEHTSELQSRGHLVFRLLHEKKNDYGDGLHDIKMLQTVGE